MEKKFDYENAVREIERIEAAIEGGDMGLDEIAAQIARASELIKLCKDKLTRTEEDVRRVLEGQDDNDAK